MKVAIPYDNGQIFPHFGRTEQFQVFQIEHGAVVSSYLLPSGGQGHGALASVLLNDSVDALICGGIGDGAREMLSKVGITLYPGVSGSTELRAAELARGELEFDLDAACVHPQEHDCSHCQAGSCHLG